MIPLLSRKFVPELLILLAIAAVFGQSFFFDFVSYDDPVYVYENDRITSGVSVANTRWALTATDKINLWHPLTWISHQIDCTIWGADNPGGHHATNVIFHAITSILAFWLLRRLTGSSMVALVAALLFAIHPQRVQSVAWISERKDVLSGAFSLASILAYLKYQSGTSSQRASTVLYCSALLFLGLGLASKPIAIVVPAVLALILLLEHGIKDRASVIRLLLPLVPLFLLAGLIALLTTWVQAGGGLGDLNNRFPLFRRLLQMPYGIFFYLKTLVLPTPGHLWVYPPTGSALTPLRAGLFALIPLAIGLLVWKFGKNQKSLLLGTGWAVLFWLPVSGIVPVSFYYVADRYTYLPHIGALLALVIFGAALLKRFNLGKLAPVIATILVVITAVVSFGRTAKWKDSETFFSHEIEINPRSLLAPVHLGDVYMDRDSPAKALPYFERAVELDPNAAIAHVNRGLALALLDRKEEALVSLNRATETKPALLSAYSHLGTLHSEMENNDEAIEVLQKGIELFPMEPLLLADLGTLYGFQLNEPSKALECYDKALQLNPQLPNALQGAGVIRLQAGGTHLNEGIRQLETLLVLQPNRNDIRSVVEQAKASLADQ